MRLMESEGVGVLAWVCLYCGTEAQSRPPYEVRYCYCRSTDLEGGASDGARDPYLSVARAV